ncbi:hypothetical protein PTTG_02079 [Puccinia triticina 1-1 BBBD Race 1]|uniref:Uncharacterized protein n=1 Tax=Puccinia triticina (isolate 1-1 / race 1 (BBBD)) TaxID=630390 RepID=A0A180GKF5_PUCT1|nr:hypothetical protein PTTG_02079 [Puccinia triticina 1-1 BBBD Race 1]
MKFEWAFYFDRILKFCWKKDIIGMPGSKRGYTCWMCQKPDSDFPCAIYRPGTSTVPPSCQFLGFNIRRIECLQDPRGLEFAIILALLGFTEGATDHEPRRSPPASPAHPARLILPGPEASLLASSCEPPGANELRVTESSVISDLVARSHKLLEDPLFLYLSLHALTPETFQRAAAVADQIKRDHLERCGEELYQYRVEDMMSQEMAGGRPVSLSASASQALMPCPLKIYLSRTSLDGLLPKLVTISSPNTNKKFGKPCAFSFHRPQVETRPSSFHGPFSSSSMPQNSLQSRFISGVHRPFSKIASIANFSSRSSAYYQHTIIPIIFQMKKSNRRRRHKPNKQTKNIVQKFKIKTTQKKKTSDQSTTHQKQMDRTRSRSPTIVHKPSRS